MSGTGVSCLPDSIMFVVLHLISASRCDRAASVGLTSGACHQATCVNGTKLALPSMRRQGSSRKPTRIYSQLTMLLV